MSYAIEDLASGMRAKFIRTVSEQDIASFGEVSGDTNPMHFDETFAQATPFRGRIAHGILTASYISTVLGMEMPGPGTIFLGLNIRFKAPVRIGDTVTAVCTVREVLPERRRVIFDCACSVGDTLVLEGEATVMPPPRKV
jgi:3-hydroxybutyryl-CoA dehydratase